jgi:hypothetical protein
LESPTAGTLFHRVKFPLLKAFYAVFFISTNKKGITSTELSRKLGLKQKVCWLFRYTIKSHSLDDVAQCAGDTSAGESAKKELTAKNKNAIIGEKIVSLRFDKTHKTKWHEFRQIKTCTRLKMPKKMSFTLNYPILNEN